MLPKRLKEIRKSHGLTQQNVADAIGWDRTTYTYYETGTNCPSLSTIEKLAKLYKVSVSYLIGETDNPDTDGVLQKERQVAESIDFTKTLSKSEKELLVFYRALTPVEKEELIKKLKKYLKK